MIKPGLSAVLYSPEIIPFIFRTRETYVRKPGTASADCCPLLANAVPFPWCQKF